MAKLIDAVIVEDRPTDADGWEWVSMTIGSTPKELLEDYVDDIYDYEEPEDRPEVEMNGSMAVIEDGGFPVARAYKTVIMDRREEENDTKNN